MEIGHNSLGISPLTGDNFVYEVFDNNGRKKLAEVEATELSEAAEMVPHLWPCRLKAAHLPYPYVGVEADGTLDMEPPAPPPPRVVHVRKKKYNKKRR